MINVTIRISAQSNKQAISLLAAVAAKATLDKLKAKAWTVNQSNSGLASVAVSRGQQ